MDATEHAPIRELPRRIHLLGAGGAGVSGAARILVERGHAVSAHDRSESEHTALLRELGVAVDVSPQESARLPADAELVIRSAAVPASDGVVVEAQDRGLRVLKYAEALGLITPRGRTLAVAGTHGKTTTSWLLHHALRGVLDADPTRALPAPGALVGGVCRTLATNAVCEADGGWFAVEACEYDRSFLQLSPRAAIVTNVEADHLDYFGDLEAVKNAFVRFVDRLPPQGLLVLGPDVPRNVEMSARCAIWRLGRELVAEPVGERGGFYSLRLEGPGFVVPSLELGVPGLFNVDNAAAALGLVVGVVAREWRLDPQLAAECAARGLARYRGAQRRFEPWGEIGGVSVVHDYAHHPTEVRVTLAAARAVFANRPLHVLFQPHQHSRTARFLDEFVESLASVDRVVVADVYGARAHIDGEHQAGAPELVAGLIGAGVDAAHGGGLDTCVSECVAGLAPNAALLVLGAGDIVQVKDELQRQLAGRGAPARGSVR